MIEPALHDYDNFRQIHPQLKQSPYFSEMARYFFKINRTYERMTFFKSKVTYSFNNWEKVIKLDIVHSRTPLLYKLNIENGPNPINHRAENDDLKISQQDIVRVLKENHLS